MSKNYSQELNDRNLVPADEIDHLNILRYAPREPPVVGIFDEPLRCHPMNEEWSKHIMGAVSGLAFWKAWTGDQDERNSAVQSIYEFMVGEVCGMFLLRQSSTNSCLLEQSVDGGNNWTPAFDFSLCLGGGSDASIQIWIDIAITNIAILNQLYIDAGLDITVMYPNLEYDAGPQDDDRNTALCYAFEALTEGVYNAVEERILNLLDRQKLLSSIIKFFTGAWWASDSSLLNALSNAILDAIYGSSDLEAAADALSNVAARRAVVCCLYADLEGATVTYALWQNAGDGCTEFEEDSDEELLYNLLAPIFAGLDAYLSWVTLLSNGVGLATDEIIGNDCLTCGEWTAEIDFKTTDGDFYADPVSQGVPMGEWENGVGWKSENKYHEGKSRDQNCAIIQLDFTAGTYTLSQCEFTYNYEKGNWNYAQQLALALTRGVSYNLENQNEMSDGDDQVFESPGTVIGECALIEFLSRCSYNFEDQTPIGDTVITSCIIRGTGTVPPELVAYLV
jgi:hypothetical protein